MHRIILGITDPKIFVDHKDHDGLNNTKDNLRIANHQQNMHNRTNHILGTSIYKGVSFHTETKKWKSRIALNGKRHNCGYFLTEEEAAKAYDKKALELHGKFALLNFPDFNYTDYIPNPVIRYHKNKLGDDK